MTTEEIIRRLKYKAENIKAKLDSSYFMECAEYLNEYRWHDLRKNPDDLPERDGCLSLIVNVCFSNGLGGYINYSGTYCYESIPSKFITTKDGKRICKYEGIKAGYWNIGGSNTLGEDVIAWKYIEPFEVEA